jgi:hypothetical protein
MNTTLIIICTINNLKLWVEAKMACSSISLRWKNKKVVSLLMKVAVMKTWVQEALNQAIIVIQIVLKIRACLAIVLYKRINL